VPLLTLSVSFDNNFSAVAAAAAVPPKIAKITIP